MVFDTTDARYSTASTDYCYGSFSTSSTGCKVWGSKTTNWIFTLIGSTNSWTITPNSNSYPNYAFQVTSSGNIGGNSTINSRGTVPVFFLTSNITLSGDGTSDSPYTIS